MSVGGIGNSSIFELSRSCSKNLLSLCFWRIFKTKLKQSCLNSYTCFREISEEDKKGGSGIDDSSGSIFTSFAKHTVAFVRTFSIWSDIAPICWFQS